MSSTPTIVVHGGAGRVAPEHYEGAVAGVEEAAEAGRAILQSGGDCEAAVVAAVRVLEDAPVFNAGRGSCMTSEQTFEVDAGIMRSVGMAHGAVAGVPNLANAIEVAQAVMNDGRHRLLVAEGAVKFAQANDVGRFDRDLLWTEKAQSRYDEAMAGRSSITGQADTVGAVAIDVEGRLCVAGSTGGVLLKKPGRVGDCPLVGTGFYADPTLGAACATGVGEAIMTHVVSYAALVRHAQGIEANEAADELCARVAGSSATCGIIMIGPNGEVGIAHRSPHMSWAVARGDMEIQSGLRHTLALAGDGRL